MVDFPPSTIRRWGLPVRALFFGLVIAVATLSGSPSFAVDDRDVTIVNGTGYGIKFLGFNNPGDDEWSDNEISSVLADGGSVYVKFNNADKGCKWNIRIDWADEGYPGVLWRNVDLCSIDVITLKYNRASDTTSFTAK
jgi:hypothetical protein